MPSRSSSPSSARQPRRTRTERSRCTLRAELALELAARGGPDRLDHLAAGADQDALLRLGLDPHAARARRSGRRAAARPPRRRPRPRAAPPGTCGAAPARGRARRACTSRGWSERSPGSKRNGPSGSRPTRWSTSGVDARARARGDREDLVADVELGGRLQREHGARAVEAVDLVDRDDDRHRRVAQRGGDEAVARADALLGVEHHQRGVGSRRARARRAAACARSARRAGAARPGRSTSTSCAVVAAWRRRGSRGASSAACRRRSRPCGRRSR